MNIVIWLVLGGVIGWTASVFMGADDRQGMVFSVVGGIVGALLGGRFLSDALGVATIDQGNFSLGALLVSFLGAVLSLTLARFARA
jgi:uncharacterized membrane protein YeaQ/YmgE (transglycosylase-associated protein family)